MNQKLYCIVGASGTGKSTLLQYVKENFAVNVTEVSARPFLPSHTDYVNSLTTDSQVLITQNRFVSFIERILKPYPTLFSRSPIDSLAYERVLKKAPFLEPLLIRQIEVTKPMIQYLYIPIEFEMDSKDDTVRGTNKEIQKATDNEIQKAIIEHGISHYEIKGSKEERFEQLDKIFKKYKYV